MRERVARPVRIAVLGLFLSGPLHLDARDVSALQTVYDADEVGCPARSDGGPHTSWDSSVRAGTTSGGPGAMKQSASTWSASTTTWNANGAPTCR